ncbi:50S ribosomal protein L37ae [Candidatus Woesearchaeota archaeon]|nr:50S ribosomal protein L37ae [Candidatus Woesearchaeota archaeon]
MEEKKQIETIKRFGARYGRTLRERLAAVEILQKQKHKCPYCAYHSVKRSSAGIWECKKCSAKFTNRAYTLEKPSKKADEIEQGTQKDIEIISKKEKSSTYKDVVGVIEETQEES